MNIYAVIILTTLLLSHILDIITEILNLRSLEPNLPDEFSDVYDAERYAKSQEYTRVRTRFGFLTGTLGLIITLVFWFAGGFDFVDQWARSLGYGNIVTGLIFMGVLLLGRSIIFFPFGLYSTFVIEEKFGFNKTTWKTYFLDMIKGLLLGIVIGGAVLAAILWFFESAGPLAWLYCWLALTVFTLIMQFIAPTWIMPLFNKFTPLEDGELRSAILGYAKSVDFPLQNLFVMDGSRRSTKSNAFFTGFGKNKRIALFDTLIEKHSVSELVAVLAHEIGHFKKKHIIQGMIISIIHSGILFYLLSIFLNHQGLYDAFYMQQSSIYAGLIFFSMLYAPIDMLLSIVMQIFSRKNEFEADYYAAKTTGDPGAMISALKKLSADNLSNLTPHWLYVFLNYSHPPVLQRIRAIRKVATQPTASS